MAAQPLTYLEKKWASGYSNSNHLVVGATQTTDRKQVQLLDKDTHRTITPLGRRTLMTLGRWLYWNVSAVRGAVDEMTDLSVETFIPQFEGANQEWGDRVEQWLREHDKICDVRGWPYDMAAYRKNLVRGRIVDGELHTLLTETPEGYPMIQAIPAHRIGSQPGLTFVQGGQYDGARIIDGVIVDEQGRAIAYRVMGENGEWGTFRDISARDLFPTFSISTADQLRGISDLGASCFDWQDAKEARAFELISQKIAASIGLIETNETGEADKSKRLLNRTSANFGTPAAGTPTPLSTTATETIDGVSIRYHRAGSNAKLEAYRADRPTANQQAFRDDVIREALNGMGWSFDYSYNPTKINGGPLRVVVDRLNRKLDSIRSMVRKTQTRVDGWRVAKVMDTPGRTDKKMVLFPFDPDWFRWSYQGPAVLTADAKYNSDVDMQERKAGMKTLAKSTAERNGYWRDVRNQLETEADDKLTRAKRLSTKHKISIELALTLLEDMTVYSSVTNSAEAVGEATAANAGPTE